MTGMSFAGKTAGVLVNATKPHAVAVLTELLKEMRRLGMDFLLDCASALSLGRAGEGLSISEMEVRCDYLIVIGGDGTILAALRDFAARPLPVLGINPGGSYGFLAEASGRDLAKILETLCQGGATIEERPTLTAHWNTPDGRPMKAQAINDLVFARGQEARIVEMEIMVDGEPLAVYGADGLVFATAAGSTAYSLAAGGPVLYPGLEAFVMTPVCPHALMNRPVIFPRGARVTLRNARPEREVVLSADGRSVVSLGATEEVAIGLGESLRFISVGERSFTGKLREKTGWQGSLKRDANNE